MPALPKGKVKVFIFTNNLTVLYYDRYSLLKISPFINTGVGNMYLHGSTINDENFIPSSVLFLGERIDTVKLFYSDDTYDLFGGVVQKYFGTHFNNLMPQLITRNNLVSLPRSCIYKGVKLGDIKLDVKVVASPVNLDVVDFEIWKYGIKFTLRLNRNKTIADNDSEIALFDIIKAEFYGELLPAEIIDDYVELKPKGV